MHRHADLIKGFALIVRGMLPLANYFLNEVSAADRDELRKLSGEYGIFGLSNELHKLSTALNGLCGEEARSLVVHKRPERKRK